MKRFLFAGLESLIMTLAVVFAVAVGAGIILALFRIGQACLEYGGPAFAFFIGFLVFWAIAWVEAYQGRWFL